MAYELFLKLYDRDGDLKKGYISPIWARYTDRVNSDDPLIFMLHNESDGVELIEEFDLIEVFIRNRDLFLMDSDGGFVSAFVAIVRDWNYSTDENGETFIEFKAPGINHLLSFRSVAWYAGVENRSVFQDVRSESIMKMLVDYNCTSNASTGNGRLRNGDLLPGMGFDVSIAADGSAGNVISATFKGSNLLTALQKIADQAAGDFALSWQGANDFEFEFYPDQLGADKSSGSDRVLFSLENGTMRDPRLIRTGASGTVAIAAGEGREELREVSVVNGDDYALDYDLEIFVDARQEKTEEGRIYRGGLKLYEKRIREQLTFSVLQTGNQFYSPIDITGRKTYRAGDLVYAVYRSEQIRKIEAIQVYWNDPSSEDAFNVDVTTREVVLSGS